MYIINYIIDENDKITKKREKSLKLIFLYNNRISNNCIYIFWTKISKTDEKSLIQIYNNNMNIFPSYLKIIYKKYFLIRNNFFVLKNIKLSLLNQDLIIFC